MRSRFEIFVQFPPVTKSVKNRQGCFWYIHIPHPISPTLSNPVTETKNCQPESFGVKATMQDYFGTDYPRIQVSEAEMPHNFEDWLKLHMQHGHIDFTMRAQFDETGHPRFYIHTQYLDSITCDFQVRGHEVTKYSNPPSSGAIGDFKAACEQARLKQESQ